MEKRQIGSLPVSVVGLGCSDFGWRLDAPRSTAVVHAALDVGITFFDTADVYGGTKSEEYLGQALGARRKDVIIATKFGSPLDGTRHGARPAYVRHAVEESLRRLGTDYIDLYQLHQGDPTVPIEETLEALDTLVKSGKVRQIGCSALPLPQIRAARAAAKSGAARFVSVQAEYSLLHRAPERAILPECRKERIAFLPFFPLASGLLTGKYRLGQSAPEGSRLASGGLYSELLTPHNLAIIENLLLFATAQGKTLLELAFSWLASQPGVTAIIAGATTAEQVRSNAKAVEWKLTAPELEEVDSITWST